MSHRTFLLFLSFLVASLLRAQEPLKNTAFRNGERVDYVLKFNWGPIWMTVGTAEWEISSDKYHGEDIHKVSLRTLTNKRADRYFVLRDTMTTYVTHDLVPMSFKKVGREGKRYKQDYVNYSYAGGKCSVSTYHRTDNHTPRTSNYDGTPLAYDMVSMMLRARSFDPAGWKKGHRIRFMMAEGRKVSKQSIVYRGKKVVELDDMRRKYRCLVFSFMEYEDNKETEIVKFYITDDANHLPVRLDMHLNFGSAIALMTHAKGLRHAETSIVR